MVEDSLEIVIITYNRYKQLENTLKELLKSPFSKYKVIIMDNASSDETPQVCAKYQKEFTNLEIIRHKKNIGANANILRAAETPNSPYSWILCDDDSYDFSDCSDVIDAIDSEKFDIIIVSSHFIEKEARGISSTTKDLIGQGMLYYHTLSFVPSSIFKTELFDSHCIYSGYFNIHNLYPHFPFINKSVEENFKVYVSKKEIVRPIISDQASFSPLKWYISWMNSCSTIKNKEIRKKMIYANKSYFMHLKNVIIRMMVTKVLKLENRKDRLLLMDAFILNFGYFSRELLILIFALFALIIPASFYKFMIKSYLSSKNDKNSRNENKIKLENLLKNAAQNENMDTFR